MASRTYKYVEESVERTQRTYIRLVFGIGLGFFLLVLLCWGGCRAYNVFESRHLTRRGAAYLGANELRQTALSARRALQLNPNNVAAVRLLARAAELSNDRSAIDWRRKAVELEPRSAEDALALANCALQFNDMVTAEKSLQRVEESARQSAEFHVTSARFAETKKKFAEAEEHWAKAVELAGDNKFYQLQFALAVLRMDNRAKRKTALSILEQLRADEKQRASATRALIADGAARHEDSEKLVTLARELEGYSEATFSDRLLYLDILRQLRDPKFSENLTKVEKDAVAKPADLAALISWMKSSGLSLLAIDFAHTLSNEQLTKWPVSLAMAEAYAKLADWSALETAIKNQNWGHYEFLRHAYLALALRSQDKPAAADREWTAAQKEAGSEVQLLWALSRAAAEWGWKNETVQLLWTLSKQPEAQIEALQNLYQRYFEAEDTVGLYRVLTKLAELQPDDLVIQNNFAQVGLLLNADIERARKLAADVYHKESSNPAYTATYAFALYTKGDARGALEVMNGLSETQLKDPAVAAYYGVVLAAAGDSEKARDYLKAGASAKLLPEEKALLAKAERALQ